MELNNQVQAFYARLASKTASEVVLSFEEGIQKAKLSGDFSEIAKTLFLLGSDENLLDYPTTWPPCLEEDFAPFRDLVEYMLQEYPHARESFVKELNERDRKKLFGE